jgi:hypothetical protein
MFAFLVQKNWLASAVCSYVNGLQFLLSLYVCFYVPSFLIATRGLLSHIRFSVCADMKVMINWLCMYHMAKCHSHIQVEVITMTCESVFVFLVPYLI